MDGTIPINYVLVVGGAVMSLLLGIIGWMLARWVDGLRKDTQSLSNNDRELSQQVATLREVLPSTYIRRDEFSNFTARLDRQFDGLYQLVHDGFARVEDKLAKKADK